MGGLPECVASWATEKNPATINEIQKELLTLYENDISKHNSKINAARTLSVFRSLVSQLAKENKKFIYGCIKEGARAREFESAIEWLVSSGLVLRVYNVTKPEVPLKAYENFASFKLFFFDVGLLKHAAAIPNKQIILDLDFQFKGALAENFCLQQFYAHQEEKPNYYSPVQNYEVDFLVQNQNGIIPIECKAGKNIASASFKRFIRENSPQRAIRFSQLPYKHQENMTNLPIYLAGIFDLNEI